jgi:hypothetical protein
MLRYEMQRVRQNSLATRIWRPIASGQRPGRSPSPGHRPGEWGRVNRCCRPNGPMVRRMIGPLGRRWAQLLSSSQGDALGWANCAPLGLTTAFALLLLALVGCSRDGRLSASGTVTLDGKPLESGVISFRPAAGGAGHSAGGQIEKGGFHLAAAHGLTPGKYLVTIQSFKLTGRTIVVPQGKVPERVLVEYKEAGKIEATVAAGANNQFDFKLTSVGGNAH